MSEFESAKDKVMMGAERRSMVMTDEEKKLTAYHESGHAIVAIHCPASDPIHKATIIPRGRSLGMVMRLPESDRISISREKLDADIAVAMGGRIAEQLVFGDDKVTSGASSDIQMATKMARAMVTQFGMSDKLGPLTYAENEQEIFLGHSVTQTKHVSEATAEIIDAEVRRIVDTAYDRARRIIEDNRNELEALAQALLEYETLSGVEITALLNGEEIVRPSADEPPKDAGKRASVPASGSKGDLEPEPQPGS
jgi:cell division protease FtsH